METRAFPVAEMVRKLDTTVFLFLKIILLKYTYHKIEHFNEFQYVVK